MTQLLKVAAAAAVIAISCGAQAQTITPRETPANIPDSMYRPDLPAVLTPQARPPEGPSIDETSTLNRFRQAYGAHRSPRIAIWWNRELSDQVASRWVSETARAGAAVGEVDRFYGSTVMGVIGADVSQTSERMVGDPKRVGLRELSTWKFEAGFADAYIDAGARLIDRATIIRTIGGGQPAASNKPDVQAVEAAALLGKADLLMEVLLTGDPDSKTGWAFRVSAKDIQTGQIVMTMTTRALAADSTTQTFEATNRGFEKKDPPLPKVEVVSRRLAIESMDRLAAIWGVRASTAAPLPASATMRDPVVSPISVAAPIMAPPMPAAVPPVPASAEDKIGMEPAAGPRAKVVNDPDVIRVSPLASPTDAAPKAQ